MVQNCGKITLPLPAELQQVCNRMVPDLNMQEFAWVEKRTVDVIGGLTDVSLLGVDVK